MDLESKLKAVKKYTWDIPDQYALRQYTKLTKKWEDKGRSRYSLANLFIIGTLPFCFVSGISKYGFVGLYGWEFSSNNITKPYGSDENLRESVDVVQKNPFITRVDRTLRLPLSLIGLGFLGKAAYEVVSNLITGDGSNLNEVVNDVNLALPFLGISSSMYIKDADPKLLDKQPFWKSGYNWLLIKADNYLSQPTPKPVPIQQFSTLENNFI